METLLNRFSKVSYWCPPKVSRPKQLEDAIRDVAARMHVRFHIHDEEEECPGFQLPGATVHYCWEFVPDA